MEKQELSVNCAICDARKVTEETLSSYASVSINTGVLLSNARSRLLLGRYSVNVNSATVIDWRKRLPFPLITVPMRSKQVLCPPDPRSLS